MTPTTGNAPHKSGFARRRRVFAGAGVFLGASAGLLVADVAQWLWLPCALPSLPRAANVVYEMHVTGVETPGLKGPTRFTTESHGLRCRTEVVTPKPAGLYRIFCMGGSTTECAYLDDADAWPALIEAELTARFPDERIQVASAGVSGATSADHVTQLARDLLPLEPDCILLMCGLNDHFRRGAGTSARAGLMGDAGAWLIRHSMTARRFERARQRLTTDTPSDARPFIQDTAGAFYAEKRKACAATPTAASAAAFAGLPDPAPGFAGNLERIADLCEGAGVRLILITHPSIYRGDLSPAERRLLWMTALITVDGTQPPMEWHIRRLARLNQAMAAVADGRGLTLIDADGRLPKDTGTFYDDCHLNISGSRRLATLITPELTAHFQDN